MLNPRPERTPSVSPPSLLTRSPLGGCESSSPSRLGQPGRKGQGRGVIADPAGRGLKSPRVGKEPLRAAGGESQVLAFKSGHRLASRCSGLAPPPLREPLSFGTLGSRVR